VRFKDKGHRRTYALFIKGNLVTQSRYAIGTDGCDTANYAPFDLLTGAPKPASSGALDPLY
jgi:hypothetical protein